MILYTSGSTGRPKGTVCDHRVWIHNARNYINMFQVGPEDRHPVRARHVPGGQEHLPGHAQRSLSFPHDARQHGTDEVVSLLSRERITITVMGASLFRALSDALEGSAAGLSALRMIRLGSETVQASDLELYRRHFPPQCRLVNGLASGEMQTIRFFSIDHETRVAGSIVPVGYPMEDKTVLLLDDSGQEVAPGEVGEIVVESRSPGLRVLASSRPDRRRFSACGDTGRAPSLLLRRSGSPGARRRARVPGAEERPREDPRPRCRPHRDRGRAARSSAGQGSGGRRARGPDGIRAAGGLCRADGAAWSDERSIGEPSRTACRTT